jgi:single-strand DNA-binding protein
MFAQTVIAGRLGKDPESRFTSSGQQVASFSVATDDSYKNRSGERQTRTTWYAVVAWSKLAEICQQFLHKGDLVLISGKMQQREWEAKDGTKRTAWELRADTMRMLGGKKANGAAKPEAAPEEMEPGSDDPAF